MLKETITVRVVPEKNDTPRMRGKEEIPKT